MCLRADIYDAVKAKRDITCYKTADLRRLPDGKIILRSVCYRFGYTPGMSYECKDFIESLPDPYYRPFVNEGFHSFKDLRAAEHNCNYEGAHEVVVMCIIPKKSLYYYGDEPKQYCSNRIRIVGWKYRDDPKWIMTPEKKKTTLLEKLKSFFKK